ncbi:NAD(P)-dependent oxidoreductase [Salinibacterium sp. NK8237]|uniref:NAD(P)-dependent oxidoreductase n=1 Tax=Salinibacterium sp. NK8237 TaxID=2792038 RepID=UPI001E4EED91|nr:NAD(P)-dependent oxidoreductase [Salinibacterium sp. NK8237]
MATVLVTSRSFSGGAIDLVARLEDAGHTVVRGPAGHDLSELAPLLANASAWIAGTGPVAAEHLSAASALQIVARYGVGFEAVDVDAANDAGVVVTNTPGANSDAVADHAVGLALAALRHTVDGDRRVRTGDWAVRRGRELGAATVGIIGFGRIGQGVARRLSGFGSPVIAVDPFLTPEQITALGATAGDVMSVAADCDVVSLHAPGGRVIIDEEWLAHARPGMVLVNTARPDLIDEIALAGALRDGRIGAYAADTLNGDAAGSRDSPLLTDDICDRVIITPHLGAQTVEAVDGMGSLAVDDVIAVLAGRPAARPVPTSAIKASAPSISHS